MAKEPRPQPPVDHPPGPGAVSGHSVYKGRTYYDMVRAEKDYYKDLSEWLERRLKSCEAFERSVNEALNSGDGTYRP